MNRDTPHETGLDDVVRKIADEALAVWSYHVQQSTEVLANEHGSGLVRLAKTEAVGSHVTQALSSYLSHESSRRRRAASELLTQVRTEEATMVVFEYLADLNVKARSYEVNDDPQRSHQEKDETLEQGGDGCKSEAPSELQSEYALIRQLQAARKIEDLDRAAVRARVDELIERLKDEAPAMRRAAARALGRAGKRDATMALIKALKDEHLAVRLAAVEALGHIRSKVVIRTLISVLNKRDLEVRRESATVVAFSAWRAFECPPHERYETPVDSNDASVSPELASSQSDLFLHHWKDLAALSEPPEHRH